MSANTKIEWCNATVNHWAGCTAVSPACDNCYAKRMAGRLWGVEWGNGKPRHRFAGASDTLRALDRKAKRLGHPLRVFHNSLSDFFDNEVPAAWRMDAMKAMADTPNLTHILLTKRIGNVMAMCSGDSLMFDMICERVWLGATIVNQAEADRDIPKLLSVPAAKRFLSMEPLLGPVGLGVWLEPWNECGYCGASFDFETGRPDQCPECGQTGCMCTGFGSDLRHEFNNADGRLQVPEGPEIHWVIAGGESGPGARPMHPDWARSLRLQCAAASVPFFFKQWGEWAPNCLCPTKKCHPQIQRPEPGKPGVMFKCGKAASGRDLDGGEWDEVPA